jgi:hypothetical protein
MDEKPNYRFTQEEINKDCDKLQSLFDAFNTEKELLIKKYGSKSFSVHVFKEEGKFKFIISIGSELITH